MGIITPLRGTGDSRYSPWSGTRVGSETGDATPSCTAFESPLAERDRRERLDV